MHFQRVPKDDAFLFSRVGGQFFGKWLKIMLLPQLLQRLSVKNDNVGSRTAAGCNVSATIVAHVAPNGRLRTDAVICN